MEKLQAKADQNLRVQIMIIPSCGNITARLYAMSVTRLMQADRDERIQARSVLINTLKRVACQFDARNVAIRQQFAEPG